MKTKDIWIAGVTRGHNGSVCLLKNGKIVFSTEEERLTRQKYDGGPLAAMTKILDFTDKLDYLVIAHTQSLKESAGTIDYTGDDMYTGLARKLGLIERHVNLHNHPQVIDLSYTHHKLHAACAFYRSGFDKATAVIIDGAGTFIPLQKNDGRTIIGWETETIFDCQYPNDFKTVYKHVGVNGPDASQRIDFPGEVVGESGSMFEAYITDRAGIVKSYEAVTEYCGWSSIEAGKTMGLFPYGSETKQIPQLFDSDSDVPLTNRNLIVPTYPNGAKINSGIFNYLNQHDAEDITLLENRRNLAYAVQKQTQEQVVKLIRKAIEITGNKKIVISGGYGLNCVANYYYLDQFKDEGVEIYVEPISNDAGTAIGAALLVYKDLAPDNNIDYTNDGLYLGLEHTLTTELVSEIVEEFNMKEVDATNEDIVNLLRNKNIVALYQGRSENGPRALGNRSILFDPTFEDGKDFVNSVKRREYFRPFAGSILEEYVHDWFDLRGMKNSPYMMYAVNCQEGVAEKIPSIIHVDGTCRIQTVTQEQNKHYYDLIKCFYDKTGIPIIFNTSFNLGGDPLVETLEDALDTLKRSEINYLYLPELGKLISK